MDPVNRLRPGDKPWRVVLDTDTANEIDDQFAIAHACLSPDRIRLEAICAAPFQSGHLTPEETVTASVDEICRVLRRIPTADPPVYRGSDRWLKASDDAVESEAADAIIELAEREDDPLLVLSIGACTNVASVLNMRPDLVGRIGVVWLGGNSFDWPHAREFNLSGDPHASRALLDSGVDLLLLPAMGVTSHLIATVPDLESHIGSSGELGAYLTQIVRDHHAEHFGWGKELWDVAATAWCVNPDWVPSRIVPAPVLTEELAWRHDPGRHPIRYAYGCHRTPIFRDLYRKIQDHG
ncbi:MAG: nucleoside hydrolase [Fimbriimonadales bacterium]|nr:nucleoside hydrolase [Fimbriimonadales bacterium]